MKPRGIVLHTVGVKGDTTAANIDRFHETPDDPRTPQVEGRGWSDIGYHFVIRKDGTIEDGRPLSRAGAHTEGANDTIGICVTGDGDTERWTVEQHASAVRLCASFCRQHGWSPTDHIAGHREAPARFGAKPTSKTCPGKLIDLDVFRACVAIAL